MHCGPFWLGGLISAADYFRGRIFPLRGFWFLFPRRKGFCGEAFFPPSRKGLPWSGFCLIIHCSLSLPVFSRPALCSLWRAFPLHGVGVFLCHQDRVFLFCLHLASWGMRSFLLPLVEGMTADSGALVVLEPVLTSSSLSLSALGEERELLPLEVA